MTHRLRSAALIGAVLTAALVLPATAAQAQQSNYVALGDSYSSGTGIADYYDDDCLLSEQAYPHLIADEIGANLDFAACSGATTDDVLSGQLDALDAETDLVTITVGGNDIGWADALTACLVPFSDCTGDIAAVVEFAENELPALLDNVYAEIETRSPGADVYVLGYPRLFNEQETCNALTQFSIDEQILMNEGADVLSGVIDQAAGAHGFTYVDVRDRFDGHAVCDDVEYIRGLAYPVVDSFHPNALGHSDGYLPELSGAL